MQQDRIMELEKEISNLKALLSSTSHPLQHVDSKSMQFQPAFERNDTNQQDYSIIEDNLAVKNMDTSHRDIRLEELAMFSPFGVYQFKTDCGSITYLNDATKEWATRNLKRSIGVGDNISFTHSKATLDFIGRHVSTVQQTKEPYSYESYLPWVKRNIDYSGLYATGKLIPVFNENGKVTEIMHLFRDIDYEKDNLREPVLRSMLERASGEFSRRKSEFLVHMSHELKTPLTGLLGLMEHLFSIVPMNAEQKELAEESKNSGKMLLNLVNDILDLSRIEVGELHIVNTEFCLATILEKSGSLMKYQLLRKRIRLLIHIDSSIRGSFFGDSLRITQVVTNLLSNAIKFSNGKDVAVTVSEAAFVPHQNEEDFKLLVFSVIDQGVGVSEMTSRQIQQGVNAGIQKLGRIGVGLDVCMKLLDLMGSCLHLISKEGKGSTFWFSLPLQLGPYNSVHLGNKVHIEVECQDNLFSRLLRDNLRTNYSDDSHLIITDKAMKNADIKTLSIVIMNENRIENLIPLPNPFYTWRFSRIVRTAQLLTPSHLKRPQDAMDKTKEKYPKQLKCRGRVLVVDDNPINRKVLCIILERMGVEYVCCTNGQEAVDLWNKDETIELIFMDCLMPVMDGYEATKKIREMEIDRRKRIPIVAITANSLQEDEKKCLEIGMDAYLTKPFQIEKVYSTVMNTVEQTNY
jgi:signal transduction histidine kinase/CheY-like chemotaxis protein